MGELSEEAQQEREREKAAMDAYRHDSARKANTKWARSQGAPEAGEQAMIDQHQRLADAEARFKAIILRIALLSEVPAKRMDGVLRKRKGDEHRHDTRLGSPPRDREHYALAQRLVALWRALNSTEAKEHLCRAAELELHAITHGLPKLADDLIKGSEKWERAIAVAEGSLREVGEQFDVSHQTVKNYRVKFNLA